MAQTTVSIRMDDTLKKNMEETCSELGMTMTTAFIMYAKKVTREKRIPFEVSIDPFYSDENMKHMKNSIQNLESGKGKAHELIED